ncbi:PspC domain-containing protein [Oerskovia sp. M15]
MSQILSRPRRGTVIAGVCAGLARRFDISPTLVRVLAVASCILPGRRSWSTSSCGSSCRETRSDTSQVGGALSRRRTRQGARPLRAARPTTAARTGPR